MDIGFQLIAQSEGLPNGAGTDENLFQGCAFSPDGLCVLTSTTSDSKLRLYNTVNTPDDGGQQLVQNWATALTAQGGDTVRSYCWYPFMNSTNPETCCFLATCRDQPVHLFDAYTGNIRATYRPFNALDEMESPTVVGFSRDGSRIFTGGFKTDRFIHVFDLSVPGRESTILRFGKTRRSSDGQKGLVSSFATSPDGRVFCVGTYAPGSIYVYDERSGAQPSGTILNGVCIVGHGKSHSRKKRRFAVMEEEEKSAVDGGTEDSVSIFSQARVKWFQSRAQGGITQMQFADQEYHLYSASRRSDAVLLWDLRMLSGNEDYQSEPIRGIRSFATSSDTNQRLEFDMDCNTNRLFIGGLDRCVRGYDTKSGKLLGTVGGGDDGVFD
eukprot:CAMPEP_0198142150 /NCGR_PEP_ID=MMETSP1443-20131203/5035_1 /TAXON_ID=186043 /ORGANISM="Entomoneis sp., Strain CCMP2396" /LENGTH=382 /DNA_ID=CAMNT_0043805107 /DNA_START=33 /DNA_END=1178 /DNA_ORIENTATION=-